MTKPVSKKVTDFFGHHDTKRVSKGETIIQSESSSDKIYFLIKGSVGQADIDSGGNEMIMNIFLPGSFLPLRCIVADEPSPHYYMALRDSIVVPAPKEDVRKFLENEPDVLFDIIKRLYSGMDGLLRKNMQLMSGDAESRILHELIICAERFGQKTDENTYKIPITETELAKYTGLTRETVSRQFSKIKQSYDVEVTRKGIITKSLPEIKNKLGLIDL